MTDDEMGGVVCPACGGEMFHFGIWSCTRCGWDAGEQIEAEVYGVQDAREPDESEVMDEDDGEID